ncbi:MAG: alkaline phosphatase [Verrucomicrobiota bacterium]|nr:alkaline phosphatase [Verrucomicrobiota bacterium]
MALTRRSFFTAAGLIAGGGLVSPSISLARESANPGAKPRHIIHLVSDGMSSGTLSCSNELSHLLRKRPLTWINLLNQPNVVSSTMNMRSLNSYVTDSSAASSSWGSGSRIVNGGVNILPDGRSLKPLYEILKEAGWKRGLVTTTEITHATPAGFVAKGLKRDAAEQIALQYLSQKVEVLLGGGSKFFTATERGDKKDLLKEYQNNDYVICQNADDLKNADNTKSWLGIFSKSHLPYTIDQIASDDLTRKIPTLAQMTRRALDKLMQADRFILQVEGGRVDHAAHTCDAASAFRDQIAFDEAIDVCLDFQKKHPETLIVITTDHGNGNPALNGSGEIYGKSNALLANLKKVRRSFSAVFEEIEGVKTGNSTEIRRILSDAFGTKVPWVKVGQLMRYFEGEQAALYDLMNSPECHLGQFVANFTGIGWTGNAHTGDYVPLVAVGPGAEDFRGFIQNIDIFDRYMKFAGIDFRNPVAEESDEVAYSRENRAEYRKFHA